MDDEFCTVGQHLFRPGGALPGYCTCGYPEAASCHTGEAPEDAGVTLSDDELLRQMEIGAANSDRIRAAINRTRH